MSWLKQRPLALAAIGLVLLSFIGGFAAAKVSDGLHLFGAPKGGKSAGIFGSRFGHPRDAHARRAGLPKPDGFAVWRQRVDTSGADPKACIELTRPLDPSKSYSDYVLVSPDPGKPPAVSVKKTELCLSGLGFYDRRITLLKGLPSKTGEKLKSNADVDFTFGEKPPYVGFAGEGVILPREDADGVGIETVNVSKLSIDVWRVPDRNLVRKSISAPEPTEEGGYASDWGEDAVGDDGRQVWKGEVAVRGRAGEHNTTVFPLGAVLKDLKPGAYVVKARDATGGRDLNQGDDGEEGVTPAQARRWILYTDMALVSYQGAEGLDITVRSLKSAKPMPGIRVALVAGDGEDLGSASTDGEGHVRFAKALLDGKGAEAPKRVMAYGPGADFTVLDVDHSPVDLSNQGVGGRLPGDTTKLTDGRAAAGVVDSYLYSDRGVYRPGETVRLVALLRDTEAKAIKDRPGFIVVKRPSGVEAFRWRFGKTPQGFASANIVLPKSAPRGRWTADLLIEGVEGVAGTYRFGVEDFAPQRLAVDLNAAPGAPLLAGQARQVGVDARFLYGASGAGLQVQGEARIKPDWDPFPKFKDFRWGDEQTPFEEKFLELPATTTDGAGHAVVPLKADDAADSAQPLKALVTASVFEPGGRPVREGAEVKIRKRPLFLGVKVDPGSSSWTKEPTVRFEVIGVDAQGARVAARGVKWTLVSENWDYDWYQEDGKWRWRRTSRDVVAAAGTFDVGSGDPARLARRLGWGDYRLVLEDEATKARTVVRFAAGWGSPAKDAEAPDVVRVSAGSRPDGAARYAQGDTVEITIKSPYPGQAQVAVATDRVIELKNVNVPKDGTTVRLKSSAAWGGGAYVMVSVIQPRDPVASPKPRRAIGLVYVPLDPKGRKLTIDLGAAEKIKGRDKLLVPVKVSGLKFGQRAHVTIAAVDQGILNLTKFESPDPVKWYFGKRALGVDYRDDYGRLLDPNLGAPAALNYGADEMGGEGLTATPIKSVALWSGIVETGLDGVAKIPLPAPEFNGELRIMAVAWTDEAVGARDQKVTVREPVVAELDLPRFLAPGDRALATLELHNLDGKPGPYTALVQGKDGLIGFFKKLYQLVVGQRLVDRVPIDAPARAGVGHVAFQVTGPGFNYPKSWDLETRTGWGPETRVVTVLQNAGESWTPTGDLLSGFTPGSATLEVSYSPFKGFDPAPIATALSRYPYGCTEQLISAAYPWLYASNVAPGPNTTRIAHPLLSDAVGRLLDRQSTDGAFGLWRVGDGEADPWLGAYATDFLLEARAQGAPVPQAAIDKALGAMRLISRPDGWAPVSYRLEYPEWWGGNAEKSKAATARLRSRASAYALLVLAKGGKGDLARLRWFHDVGFKTETSPLARAQVALGLHLMGDEARARSAMRQAVEALGYKDPDDWYQSELRDLGGVIALAYQAGEPGVARKLQGRLDGAVKDPDNLNTQEQARLLQAADAMLRAAGVMRVEATGANPLIASGGAKRWGVGRLADAHFINRGSGALWRTVTVRGSPSGPPGSAGQGLSVSKSYFSLTGGSVNPAQLSQGDRLVIRISGRSSQGQTMPLVIDDALPAGFEIETVLGPEDASEGPFKFLGELKAVSVQEKRDDRYIAAMSLPGNQPYAVAYVVRAVTPGDFYLPGVEVRDMYHHGTFARSSGGRTAIAAGG